MVRALASHPCGLGLIPRFGRHMWVEFVVGSHPCSKRFISCFPLSSKTNISKFQFDLVYCQALNHKPLAQEILEALPVLLTLNKLLLLVYYFCVHFRISLDGETMIVESPGRLVVMWFEHFSRNMI